MSTPVLSVSGLHKRYGNQVVLDDLHVDVAAGEFLTLLGPSGSGKTTALRIIAGFLRAEHGTISISGHNVTTLSPHLRGIGFVFQDYALFPHMTVERNISYGLRVRKANTTEQRRRSTELLELLGLDSLGHRYPHELSGGQQQRVALGRALALQPAVLLMDEPLSNLDARLRDRVGEELQRLQRRLGISTVYVTHDQQEAMTLSDRVAVLSGGVLQDVQTPEGLYTQPANAFTAHFVGHGSSLAVHDVKAIDGPRAVVTTSLGTLEVHRTGDGRAGGEVFFRPEQFALDPTGAPVRVTRVAFLGATRRVTAVAGSDTIVFDIPLQQHIAEGETITLRTLAPGTWFPRAT